MIKYSLVFFLFFYCSSILSQELKLELRLKNSQPEFLYLTFFERGVSIKDTFQKKDNGYYYLSSTKIKSPQVIRISSSSVTITDIFVAPGYDLLISGDASDDFYQLNKNIHISGIGQKANLYNHMRDSLWETRPIKGLSPYGKNEKTFLNSLTAMRLLTDTLLQKYLLLDAHDSAHLFFANLKKIDNKYDQIGYLLGFAKNFNEDYKYSKQILENYAHFDLAKDLNDSLLISESFRSFITYHYINFIVNQENQTDSGKHNQLFTRVDVANKIYSGDVKQYALSNILDKIVSSITNIDELKSIKNNFFQRVNYLSSNTAKKEGL